MAVDLADFVESMRREVTPLGSTLFSDVSDDDFVGYMADAFWEARMDGFFTGYSADDDGVITHVNDVDEDDESNNIGRTDIALILIYAGIRVLRNRILNTQTTFRAKAGPVEFETQASATMLAEMLKQLRDTKARIIEAGDAGLAGSQVVLFDWIDARPENYRLGGYNHPAIGG